MAIDYTNNKLNFDASIEPERDQSASLGDPERKWNKIYVDQVKGRVTIGQLDGSTLGEDSTIEGKDNIVSGANSHAEGKQNEIRSVFSHVEGSNNIAYNDAEYTHIEGTKNKSYGKYSHLEGKETLADTNADYSHCEGYYTQTSALFTHAEGGFTLHKPGVRIYGPVSISGTNYTYNLTTEGSLRFVKTGSYLILESVLNSYNITLEDLTLNVSENVSLQTEDGFLTLDPEGGANVDWATLPTIKSISNDSTTITLSTTVPLANSVNSATNAVSFYIIQRTRAQGYGSHAEGCGVQTTTAAQMAHAEGLYTRAEAANSHAEGYGSKTTSNNAHAEGCKTAASGPNAHAEGSSTVATGANSHSEGEGTIAYGRCTHVFGMWNGPNTPNNLGPWIKRTYIEMVGNGTDEDHRSNARLLDWKGNETLAGGLTAHGANIEAFVQDYAERRQMTSNFKPGQVVCENGNGTMSLTTQRLTRGCEIISDTYGCVIGREDIENNLPIAVSGRVLAYPDKDPFSFEIGAPVCAGENGTISQMTEEEERLYPSRIIGTVSEIPTYDIWDPKDKKIKVDGRIWIRIR